MTVNSTNGYIIVFAPDLYQPMVSYWDGQAQVPMDNTTNPQDAAFYPGESVARGMAAQLQLRYPSLQVGYVAVNRTIAISVPESAAIALPAPPAPPASSSSPASAPTGNP